MEEPTGSQAADTPEPDTSETPDGVGEALRSAVERTLAATAGSASETSRRARDLLDEVARRGEVARDELTRRGGAARDEVVRRRRAARDEVARRGEAAREEVARVGEEASTRLADAIADLRQVSHEDLGLISDRIGAIEGRLADLERALRGDASDEGGNALREPTGGTEANPRVEGERGASGGGPDSRPGA